MMKKKRTTRVARSTSLSLSLFTGVKLLPLLLLRLFLGVFDGTFQKVLFKDFRVSEKLGVSLSQNETKQRERERQKNCLWRRERRRREGKSEHHYYYYYYYKK